MAIDNVTSIDSSRGKPQRSDASPETVTLRFRQSENQVSPDLLIVALRYLFEAIEQRLDQAPDDEGAAIGANYLAMAGAELAQLLEARQID